MKINYQANKGQRIKHNFLSGFQNNNGWWYNQKHKLWEYLPNLSLNEYTSHRKCKSIRAFRRMLKKAPYGVTFTLNNKWFGHDIIGIGSCKTMNELEFVNVTGMTIAEDVYFS